MSFPPQYTLTTIGALRGVFGFGSWAQSALVKWNVSLFLMIKQESKNPAID